MTKVTEGLSLYTNFDSRGLSAVSYMQLENRNIRPENSQIIQLCHSHARHAMSQYLVKLTKFGTVWVRAWLQA